MKIYVATLTEDARRICSVGVEQEKLRQLVEARAQRFTRTRNQGELAPAWTGQACETCRFRQNEDVNGV